MIVLGGGARWLGKLLLVDRVPRPDKPGSSRREPNPAPLTAPLVAFAGGAASGSVLQRREDPDFQSDVQPDGQPGAARLHRFPGKELQA